MLLVWKLHLLRRFEIRTLGDRILDSLIVCAPALCLLIEFNFIGVTTQRREKHRPEIQMFDLFLQVLFILKVAYGLFATNGGRLVGEFLKSRLLIGPSPYA